MGYLPVADAGRRVFERLHRVLYRGADSTEYGECKRCGSAVDDDDARCPDCGSDEIANYTF